MNLHHAHWGRTLFWGLVTGLLYALMFSFADDIIHAMHTTPDACVVVQNGVTTYLHHPDAAQCAAQGGSLHGGLWYLALVPIALAFAISYAHGTFTGLFWDSMGLKPAHHDDKH